MDTELDELLEGLPAVSLEGPKAVGKTETALRRALTVHRLDDPAQLEIVRGAPTRLTVGDSPILVDEWQRLPATWDLVRRAVDRDPRPARFLLTGSAAPSDAPTHSGAGRIVTVRMRPMALAERGVTTPTVRLAALLQGDRPALGGATRLSLTDYADEITQSGFPALRSYAGRLLRAQLDGYVDRIAEREFVELGKPVRNAGALRRWLTAYAAASSTTASYETIRDAASAGESDKPAKTTTRPYRAALEQLWIVEPLPAWAPGHEVDLIVERRDGRVVALEVKLSATVDDADTRHLAWLAQRLGPDLLDAVVITTGREAYRRADGIGVIPAGLLTA